MKLSFGVLLLLSPGRLRVGSVAHVRRKAPVREKKAYDTSVRAFSPDGSIYQVEYAVQAADKGGLTIGVQTDQGVVLVAQGRRRSPLLKSSSVSKIADIDARMCCAMSGLLPDGRLLVDCARTWVQEHRFEFDEAPSVEAVASQVSRLALKFNGYDKDGKAGSGREGEDGGVAMSRPVGVALLMAGIDRGTHPVLYHLDPSGAYVQWRARAIGEKGSTAEAKLEKVGPFDGMTLRRAMSVVLTVLKEVLGDDFSTDRLEMVCVDMGIPDTAVGGSSSGDSSGDDSEDNRNGGGGGKGTEEDTPGNIAAAVVQSPDGGQGPSTRGGSPTTTSPKVTNSADSRESGSGGGGRGTLEAGNRVINTSDDGSTSSSAAAAAEASRTSFMPRYGYFRRVPKSEMEELLADAQGSINKRSE